MQRGTVEKQKFANQGMHPFIKVLTQLKVSEWEIAAKWAKRTAKKLLYRTAYGVVAVPTYLATGSMAGHIVEESAGSK